MQRVLTQPTIPYDSNRGTPMRHYMRSGLLNTEFDSISRALDMYGSVAGLAT